MDSIITTSDQNKKILVDGIVKWYSTHKGYGFIIADDKKLPNILIGKNCLERFNIYTLYTGSKVQVLAEINKDKGLAAVKILSVQETNDTEVWKGLESTHGLITEITDWTKVTVKWFNKKGGFGFLVKDSRTPDIFLHAIIASKAGINHFYPGMTLETKWGKSQKGNIAVMVRL